MIACRMPDFEISFGQLAGENFDPRTLLYEWRFNMRTGAVVVRTRQ